MNVKIKNIMTKISGAVSKKVMIIAIGSVVTVTAATVVGVKMYKKNAEPPVNVGAVATSEKDYQAQQKALKEQEDKKANENTSSEKDTPSNEKEENKDSEKPSNNEDKNSAESSSDKEETKPSTSTSTSNSNSSSTSKPSTNNNTSNSTSTKPSQPSNNSSSNTTKPSTPSNPTPSTPTTSNPTPSKPSGYDASVTQKINASAMTTQGYTSIFSSEDLNKLISAALSIANGNGMPNNAKNFHDNDNNVDVSYTEHSVNTVFMGNEPARYYTQFIQVSRHYGSFDYAVAYWNASKSGYDVKYVRIGY